MESFCRQVEKICGATGHIWAEIVWISRHHGNSVSLLKMENGAGLAMPNPVPKPHI